jgi:hypothetical protein
MHIARLAAWHADLYGRATLALQTLDHCFAAFREGRPRCHMHALFVVAPVPEQTAARGMAAIRQALARSEGLRDLPPIPECLDICFELRRSSHRTLLYVAVRHLHVDELGIPGIAGGRGRAKQKLQQQHPCRNPQT